jgi:hypothetical protein
MARFFLEGVVHTAQNTIETAQRLFAYSRYLSILTEGIGPV